MDKRILDLLKKKINNATQQELDEALEYIDMVQKIALKAKEEVFDDIDRVATAEYEGAVAWHLEQKEFNEIKQRHLKGLS